VQRLTDSALSMGLARHLLDGAKNIMREEKQKELRKKILFVLLVELLWFHILLLQ